MELTREQAIAEHRKMWSWIAGETERTGHKLEKRDYFIRNGISEKIFLNCFCCEYVHQNGNGCVLCPIDWGNYIDGQNRCMESLLYDWTYSCDSHEESAQLARQIANLPERTDNIPVSENQYQ